MVKKLSLKEFYENHGNTKPLSSCLPTKPGDVPRDADQGYDNGHRIADLALDSHSSGNSKPHYRDETFFVGGGAYHGPPRSNGHHYGSSSDVHVGRGSGDVDYYGSSASYHQGRPYAGGPPPPGRYGRAPYPMPPPPASGPVPVGPAAHSAAGPAGPGAAPMGSGSTPTYGAYAAPLPPHGPAGAGRGTYGGGGAYPVHVPPPADEDVWYPPPPPPPPRPGSSNPSNQVPTTAAPTHGGRSNATACSSVGTANMADVSVGYERSATAADEAMCMPPPSGPREQHVPPQPAATAKPADKGMAKGVVPAAGAYVPSGSAGDSKPAVAVVEKETPTPAAQIEKPAATPFASGSPPAPVGPKNEFAERLAARAMSHAKSSLLAGGGSTSSSLTTALSGAGSDALGGDDSGEQGNGAFVKPTHPFGRPRLVLKPRTAPLPDSRATTPSHHGGNTSSASSDSGTDVGEHGSSASVASSNGRPRLQLQPRSLPLADETGGIHGTASSISDGRPRLNLLPRGSSNAAADSDSAPRKASVFGEAKPKDLPDPALMDGPAMTTSRLSEAAVARLGSGSASHGGRLDGGNSVASGDREYDWQTAGRGRKGSSKFADDCGSSVQLDDGPFFGSNNRSSYVSVPAPRAFDRDIMRDGRGYGRQTGIYGDDAYSGSYGRKYGSPNGHGWGGRRSSDATDADYDEGVFRRALPTRQLPLAI